MSNDLKKMVITGIIVLVILGVLSCMGVSDEAAGWEKAKEAIEGLVRGIILTLAIGVAMLLIYLFKTPGTFENEMVLAQDAKFDEMVIAQDAKFDELARLIKKEQAERAASEATAERTVASLKAENTRLASRPEVVFLRQKIGKFIGCYKEALEILNEFKGRAINLLQQSDEQCSAYLAAHIPTYWDFFSTHGPVVQNWYPNDEDDPDGLMSRLAPGDAEMYTKLCKDRLAKLGEILRHVG